MKGFNGKVSQSTPNDILRLEKMIEDIKTKYGIDDNDMEKLQKSIITLKGINDYNDATNPTSKRYYTRAGNRYHMVLESTNKYIAMMNKKNVNATCVLYYMIDHMDVHTNLFSGTYKLMDKHVGMTPSVRSRAIKFLKDHNFIKQRGTNKECLFTVNQNIAFKGSIESRVITFDEPLLLTPVDKWSYY